MFARKDFIELSRKFVCIRIETFENKESEKIVRSLLNGRFENTSFCMFAPDAKTRLSATGRSPAQGLAPRRRPGPLPAGGDKQSEETIIRSMKQLATKYKTNGSIDETLLQDFNAFRQALNITSGDQRLLLFVAAEGTDRKQIEEKLKPIMVDKDIIGKFHVDFMDQKTDASWTKSVTREKGSSGLFIIHSSPFGMDGTVINQLPLTASPELILSSLLVANDQFSKAEVRKSYSAHVSQGRRQGIFFENTIPYGEDRDGDGKIDHRGGPPRRR